MTIFKQSSLFRILSICLVVLLTFSLLGSTVSAAEPRTTVYLSDDTMDYVTGTRTYYFTVPGEYIPNESPYLTTTYQICISDNFFISTSISTGKVFFTCGFYLYIIS